MWLMDSNINASLMEIATFPHSPKKLNMKEVWTEIGINDVFLFILLLQ